MTRTRPELPQLWQTGRRSAAEAILLSNPNVGVEYRVVVNGEITRSGSYFGKDAADFLYGIDLAVSRGLLSPVTGGTTYAHVVGTVGPQNTETAADLAKRAATGFSNHPGLLEQIQANTAAGVDVHIVACQAAKESNYAKLSQVPFAFKNGGEYLSGAVGADGEIGLLQIKPSTAGLSANDLKNVGTNVKAASNYLIGL